MIDQASVPSLMGSTIRDGAGEKIGKVGQVYLDDTTGQPEWVTVRTGLFGTKESFLPLAAARVEGDDLVVDIPKAKVHDAPRIDEDGHLSEEQETELYTYYGVSQGPFGRPTATDAGAGDPAGFAGTDPVSGEEVGPDFTPDVDAERAATAGAADPAVTGGVADPTLAGGAADRAAGAEEPSATSRRLRRWMVSDERSTTPVVDEGGEVVGEISSERVDVRPLDEDGDRPR